MKGMKWSFIPALSLAMTVLIGSARADAAVAVTVKNNRSHNISIAFCWAGFDDFNRSGWYNVKAGETRTITFEKIVYVFTSQDFGYYATGGGRTWQGKATDERPRSVIIHPKNKFSGWADTPVDGGKKVYFRPVELKKINSEDGSLTLTFNE